MQNNNFLDIVVVLMFISTSCFLCVEDDFEEGVGLSGKFFMFGDLPLVW